MKTVQVQNPISGYYELYNTETAEKIDQSDRPWENVPTIGNWEDPSKSKNARTVIEGMADELEEIRSAMQRLEDMGFSLELMEIYIYKKTSVNLTEIRKVLASQREFLREAFKETEEI